MNKLKTFFKDRNVRIFLLAVLFDFISRDLFTNSNLVYFLGQDLMVSTLIYLIIVNLKRGFSKTLVKGFFTLSILQCISEIAYIDTFFSWIKEILVITILTITTIQINKQILNKNK